MMNKFVKYGLTVLAGILLGFGTVKLFAKPIAITEVSAGKVVLFDERRDCPNGAFYFELRAPDRTVKGCWKDAGDGNIVVQDEEGDGGFLPKEWFQPVESAKKNEI